MNCIDTVPREELRGKKVLVRAGLDLPLDDKGEVTDLFRVKKSLATLQYLKECDENDTNAPVARALKRYIDVTYVPDIFGHLATSALQAIGPGDFVLLENLQQDPGEKANDPEFCKHIASLGDIYVNDCFPSAHRDSAGMVGLPKIMPSYAGIQFNEEVTQLSKALNPPHPAFAIIGGAKFETKIPVINLFLQKYDHTFVTGALANDVFKAHGYPVGRSRVSDELPTPAVIGHARFMAPIDVTVQRSDGQAFVKKLNEVTGDDKIVDMGPDTLTLLAPHIERAEFVIWNGPTGLYEEGFTHYTHALAELIARRVANGGHCIIGGGDTIAALEGSGIAEDKLGFLSTGGGAMLEYLVKGSLPAIEALQ
jgi:phosphoglycerate kinase